jgi:site-specific DNA recombinase
MGTTSKNGKLHAIGIVRVSQRDGDASEHSPEVQVRAMVKHAADHGWILDPHDILDENIDTNGKVRKVSGSWDLSDRPKMAAAVAAIQAGTHQIILAERFDRLFRDLDVQRETIRLVEASGGRLATVRQGEISHATAEAEMHANIDGVMAQYTKRRASDSSWDAVELAIEAGRWLAPRVPFGYRRGPDGHLVLYEREAQLVREAFELRAGGATVKDVHALLAAAGVKLTLGAVSPLLANRAYLGELHFGKHTPNLKAHPAIVTRSLFDRVDHTRVSPGRLGKSNRLLARQGILFCASCEGRMSVGSQRRPSGKVYPHYACAAHTCTAHAAIGAPKIERMAAAVVRHELANARGIWDHQQELDEARDAAEAALAELQKSKRAIIRLGLDDDPVAMEEYEAKQEAVELADDEVARLERSESAHAFALGRDWDELDLLEQRQVLKGFVARILVAPGRSDQRVTFELLRETAPGSSV